MADPLCRFCDAALTTTFADLGETPLANSYLTREDLLSPEPTYPLHARVCGNCYLVQLPEVASPEAIFGDYAYYSSYSSTWLEHSKRLAEMAIERFALDDASLVVEVASNDGYLLQYFQQASIPVLGIEPARNIAEDANAAGIPTESTFFGEDVGRRLAGEGRQADLLIGNNVLAHVPDINDFVAGLASLLATDGTLLMEFPHLLNLIRGNQWDTIYHEHFSYLSLLAVEKIFAAHGLELFDVEQVPTHGGSLRIFAAHTASGRDASAELETVRRVEAEAALDDLDTYGSFSRQVDETRAALVDFLRARRDSGKKVVAYGAAAKGNTLLNTSGVDDSLVSFVVDRSPHKQGLHLPGSHLEIRDPSAVFEAQPDYLLILPWNLQDEIMSQMAGIASWGGKFVTPIPRLSVHSPR